MQKMIGININKKAKAKAKAYVGGIGAYLKKEKKTIERTDLRIAILSKNWSRQGRILDAIKARGRA